MAMQVAGGYLVSDGNLARGLERDREEEEMRVIQAANNADKPQQLSWIVSVLMPATPVLNIPPNIPLKIEKKICQTNIPLVATQ